jgi:hypothetical protein
MDPQTQLHAGDGGVPAPSAHAQQAAALGKKHEQQHADNGDVGGVPAASARAQQAAALDKQQEQQLASSLNPTAARLLREAIVSQPDGGKPADATRSSDILAFVRAVDRTDSPLE